MGKEKTKGTVLQLEIASIFTAIGQVISLDGPEGASESYESDTLDNALAGIPTTITGRSTGGEISGSLYLDPVNATHQAFTDLITTPVASAWKMIFADAAATEWPFAGSGIKFKPSVALGEGLKADFGVTLDGLVTYPT